MTRTEGEAIFSIVDVQTTARAILETEPDPIVARRLLREVLRVPPDDSEMAKVRSEAISSKWVHQLEQAQLPDGSWGRFHSQDTKQKTVFRTTEEAIDRAIALGLDPNAGALARVRQYIQEVLGGRRHITDRDEKNEVWPLGIKLILAGRLAQLDPTNEALEPFWTYLVEVASQAFKSGMYRLEDEAAAYLRLSGINWPQGFLESQHALWILSSRKIPNELEQHLVNWIWHKPDGIRYLRAPLNFFQPRLIGYWLRSMGILSRFEYWRKLSVNILNEIWSLRDEHGLWDFGTHLARSIDFPLSESWHQGIRRKQDYSACILVLLRKFFD